MADVGEQRHSAWLCNLIGHELLRRSFVPPKAERELRELVRYRRSLIAEWAREFNRLEKVLEGANLKLSAVASKLTGKSMRLMLGAMVNGETDPETLVELAKSRLRNQRDELVQALQGLMGNINGFCSKSNWAISVTWMPTSCTSTWKFGNVCALAGITWSDYRRFLGLVLEWLKNSSSKSAGT